MADVSFVSATQNKIATGQKLTGRLILTSDSCSMYWDIDESNRIEITDIIKLPDETSRTSLLAPFEKFYYVITTGVLWHYHGNTWNEVGGNVGGSSNVISLTKPVGQKENDTWLEIIP